VLVMACLLVVGRRSREINETIARELWRREFIAVNARFNGLAFWCV